MRTPKIDTQALEEHFRSSIEKRLAGVELSDDEEYYMSPATKLLEKRRDMQEVEQGLSYQKQEFQLKMESVKNRRQELKRKENQLKESLVKFDKFLRENEAKMTRALKKAQEERRVRETKEQEIVKLRGHLTDLIRKRERQNRSLKRNAIYQKYLEAVVENSGSEFSEVKDVISRFDTLTASNTDLIERAKKAQESNENQRTVFSRATEEMNNSMLNYTNTLAQLQTRLEESQHETQKWQEEWDRIVSTASQKSLLLGQIKMTTNNLFNLVKGHMENRMVNTINPVEQLDRIEQFVIDLNEVTDYLVKQRDREKIENAAAELLQVPKDVTKKPDRSKIETASRKLNSIGSTLSNIGAGSRSASISVHTSLASLTRPSSSMQGVLASRVHQ